MTEQNHPDEVPDKGDTETSEQDDAEASGNYTLGMTMSPADRRMAEALSEKIARGTVDPNKLIPPWVVESIAKIGADFLRTAKVLEPYLISLTKIRLPDITGVGTAITRLLQKMPPNWPPMGSDLLARAFAIVQDDGIPLVWVPRRDIVTALLIAQNRDERIDILIARADEVIEDCHEILSETGHPDMEGQFPLAFNAVDALSKGSGEAAQALATLVTETVVSRTFKKRYVEVQRLVKIDDPGEMSVAELRIRTALAAIGPFYTPWRPSDGTPAPAELSRHVTVHQADVSHYTRGNNIIAVMLMTSVLRAVQELLEPDPLPDRTGTSSG